LGNRGRQEIAVSAEYLTRVRENLPPVLRDLPIWLLWREVKEPTDRKPKKVPLYANGRARAKTDTPDDRAQLVVLSEAEDAFRRMGGAGLGIALGTVPGEDIHISGIDLDNCYAGTDLDPRAQQLLMAAHSYAEKSPSGNGLHILGTGDAGTLKKDADGLEIYSGGRYFTVTGEVLNRAPLGDITEAAQLARALYRTPTADPQTADTPSDTLWIRAGSRHNHALELGRKLRAAGLRGAVLQSALSAWNGAHCVPPLALSEVTAIATWCSELTSPGDIRDAIRSAIAADLAAGPDAIDTAEPPRCVVHNRLWVAGSNLAGVGGAGKTTVTLNEYVHIVCGGALYGEDVVQQGPCLLVTAEDGSGHPRYLLRRVLQDGVNCGALMERAVQRARYDIKIIGWSRSAFGAIATVDRDGNVTRAPGFEVLLEQIAPLRPAIVTLDPSALFSPGERFGNDGEAFLASMLHEAALSLGCCFQVLDHVSQAVARGNIVDQHAARGGTAKTDNARLARQLVRFKPTDSDRAAQPLAVTAEDIAEGRILQLHWTKCNYGPLPSFVWLRRRGYWVEHLRSASPDQIEAQRRQAAQRLAEEDVRAVVDTVRVAVVRGEKPSPTQLEEIGVQDESGRALSRHRVRTAVARAEASGRLRRVELPESERRGARKEYLLPV
jgi:RecA-family ATPase